LLKNPENLDDTRNERQRLDEALKLNKPLATVYYMKEDLRAIDINRIKTQLKKSLVSGQKRSRIRCEHAQAIL